MSREDPRGSDALLAATQDADAAQLLRSNLAKLARQHPHSPMAAAIDEVLAGRRPVRNLLDDPEFSKIAQRGVADYQDYLRSLTDLERQRLTEGPSGEKRPGRSGQPGFRPS